MVSRTAFEGLTEDAAEQDAPVPVAPVLVDGAPVAVYLTGPDDSWCTTRHGVWWPTVGLWVDRMELTTEDVPPAGARTYPLVPVRGYDVGAVHGQVDPDGVAHVLVTGPGGEVITQGSAAADGPHDRSLLVLATLVAAAGQSETPQEPFTACATDKVLAVLDARDWASGWTLELDDLPGRVVRVLGV